MQDYYCFYRKGDVLRVVGGFPCTADEKTLLAAAINRLQPVFPVSVGDTVYLPVRDDYNLIVRYAVIEVGVNSREFFFRLDDEDQEQISMEEIGRSVFLSEAEAEDKCPLWRSYVLSVERAETLGSGSDYTEVARCNTWEEAQDVLARNPQVNHITRTAKGGRRQWYDFTKKLFRDY